MVLDYLDHSWQVEMTQLGFRPPLADDGVCGPDGSFDVFLWRGLISSYVDAYDENPATPWDDYFTYMVLDPWGPYGGPILDSTVAHELNHACQASDDWWDSAIVFEMTSVFIEDIVYDDDDQWYGQLADFQANADWPIDYDDGYETWYMYGAALYLHYLRERWFDGDASFVADMWLAMRNPAGTNEPDFEDALDDLLAARGAGSFEDSVVEFSRWRWYAGSRDDGAHFAEGASFPPAAQVPLAASVTSIPASIDVDPMMFGSVYIDVPYSGTVRVSLASVPAGVRYAVSVVRGSGDQRLDLSSGSATFTAPRTLVVTALPSSASSADPDNRDDTRYDVTVNLAAP
jgi:hypothetical protein